MAIDMDAQKSVLTMAAAPVRRSRLRIGDELALLQLIGVAVIVGSLLHPAFLTPTNLINVLQQSSELSVLVLAEAIILIVGKFDLSLESIVGVAPMFAAWLVSSTAINGSGLMVNPYLAVLLIFVVGIAVGTFNGWLIVRLKLNAFITTLAMLILLRGISIGMTNGRTLYDLPGPLLYLGNAHWLGLPASVWVSAGLYLTGSIILSNHRFGRALYAIGGNAEAARAAGIRVDQYIWTVFAIGGGLAALSGLMLTGRMASVLSGQGQNMIFTVFAAAVIGRISLNGGKGSILGALCGVILLGIISNILTLSNVETFWISATYGAIILLSLIVTRLTAGKSYRSD
ncbi:MAG: ABC transporter permease [Methylobacteriaceae bacterium]|nr:ABC transporter permease [Methylobacteriaceae bacterium]